MSLSEIPADQLPVVRSILALECPSAQTIRVVLPAAAPSPIRQPQAIAGSAHSVFLPDQYTLINLGTDLTYKETGTGERGVIGPEWFVLEKAPDGYSIIDAKTPECRGPLQRVGRNSVAEADWGRNIINTKNFTYFEQGTFRPRDRDAYILPDDCTDFDLILEAESLNNNRPGWKLTAKLIQSFVGADGETTRIYRGAKIDPLAVASREQAVTEGRRLAREMMRYTDSRFTDQIFQNPDDMQLVEYRDWIGEKPDAWKHGVDMFDFGWFTIVNDDRSWSVERLGSSYSDVRRLGEAVLFDAFEGNRKVATYVIAPYPYGETDGAKIASIFLGFTANDFVNSDYFMRQIVVCKPTKVFGGDARQLHYNGIYELRETLDGSCNFGSAGAVESIFAHFQSGGQAGNPDRQSMLTRMSGGGTLVNLDFPCGDRPEFRIENGVMRLRDDRGAQGCATPSEPVENLSSAYASRRQRVPADPVILLPAK